jgi:cell division protein FtsA
MDGGHPIKVADLNNIIEARAEEIVANVWHQLHLSGYEDKLLAGIVLTGGASNLKNLDQLMRKQQKVEKIRVAKTTRETIHGPGEALRCDGSQNTLYGLLLSGDQNCYRREAPKPATTTSGQPTELDFGDDPDWKAEQERLKEEKIKKDEEDRKRQKEQREKKERQEANKRNRASWIDRFTRSLFDDDSPKMEDDK